MTNQEERKFISTYDAGRDEKNSMDWFIKHTIPHMRDTEDIIRIFDTYPFFEIRRACIARMCDLLQNLQNTHLIDVWTDKQIEIFTSQRLVTKEDREILRALFERAIWRKNKQNALDKLLEYLREQRNAHAMDKFASTKDFYKLLYKVVIQRKLYSSKIREFVIEELERLEPEIKNLQGVAFFNMEQEISLLIRTYKFIKNVGDVELLETVKKYTVCARLDEDKILNAQNNYFDSFFELYGWRLTVRDLLLERERFRQELEKDAKLAQIKLNRI